jgi:hypothetical protein
VTIANGRICQIHEHALGATEAEAVDRVHDVQAGHQSARIIA